jgi:hypothetical protein
VGNDGRCQYRGGDELLETLLVTEGSLAAWQAHHDHDLHRPAAMETELRRTLTEVTIEAASHLFRYLSGALANAPGRDALAEQEAKLIADGAVAALGRRLRGTVG